MATTQYKVDQQRFIDLYLSDVPNDEIAKVFGITVDYIYSLVKRYKLPRRKLAGRPVPEGFAEDAPHMTYNALKVKYGAHPSTLSRWATMSGVVVGIYADGVNAPKRPPPPADFRENATRMPINGPYGLKKHYGVPLSIIEHWFCSIGLPVEEAIAIRKQRTVDKVPEAGSFVAQAAHFLRKFYRNIHSTNILMREMSEKSIPNAWWFYKGLPADTADKYYVSGEGIVSQDWIIKEAKRKGWRRDYGD